MKFFQFPRGTVSILFFNWTLISTKKSRFGQTGIRVGRGVNRIFRGTDSADAREWITKHSRLRIVGVQGVERPRIEGRVRERARARLEWDDVWDGTVVPAKVVRGPTVSARRSKTRRTGCHRAGLSSFFARRSSFCAAWAPRYISGTLIHPGLLSSVHPWKRHICELKTIACWLQDILDHFCRFYRIRQVNVIICCCICLMYRVYN